MTRRDFMIGAAASGLFAAGAGWTRGREESFEIVRSDDEWRARLTRAQYRVLRRKGTERPFTSPLLEEKRAGTYRCAACDLPLYSSATKFRSGTGWPSFWAEIEGNVVHEDDHTLFGRRTEVLCRRCGGHLGHVFADGPEPTGMRHCINGVALTFEAAG